MSINSMLMLASGDGTFKRPYNTLFMLSSVDGKISSGCGDTRDFDKDLPGIVGNLNAYYETEKTTDYWSMISGETVMKLGAGVGQFIKEFHKCGHILIDSNNLTLEAIDHVAGGCEKLILVTDPQHTARRFFKNTVEVITVPDLRDVSFVMQALYEVGVKAITVQTGGSINSALIRAGLIDRADLFIAPAIVGGFHTSSLADGDSITADEGLNGIANMTLMKTETYGSLIRLVYKVKNRKGTTTDIGYHIDGL